MRRSSRIRSTDTRRAKPSRSAGRPHFTVRDGATMQTQEVKEGKVTLSVDKQKGVDFRFSSSRSHPQDRGAVRALHRAGAEPAGEPDRLGPAGALPPGAELGRHAGPGDQRLRGLLQGAGAPRRARGADRHALRHAVAGRPLPACSARRPRCSSPDRRRTPTASAKLGMIGDVDTYMAQNVKTHTVGVATGTPAGQRREPDGDLRQREGQLHADARHRRLEQQHHRHPEGRATCSPSRTSSPSTR